MVGAELDDAGVARFDGGVADGVIFPFPRQFRRQHDGRFAPRFKIACRPGADDVVCLILAEKRLIRDAGIVEDPVFPVVEEERGVHAPRPFLAELPADPIL